MGNFVVVACLLSVTVSELHFLSRHVNDSRTSGNSHPNIFQYSLF
jgi:hypothetical protein